MNFCRLTYPYKKRLILLLFVIALVFPLNLFAQKPEKLNKDWLKNDVENFIEFTNFIERKNYNFDDFKQLKNIDFNQVWWMLGGSRSKGAKNGGYTSINFFIVKSGVKIIYLDAEIRPYETHLLDSLARNDKKLQERMRLWQAEKVKINDSTWGQKLHFTYSNQKEFDRLYRLMDRFYGKKDSVNIKDSESMKYYRILMYPIYAYPYADSYGYPPQIPEGRIAMEYLIKHKRFDLLNNVLKGYNPEGKVYAIEALARENKITAENWESIRFLIEHGGVFQSMSGCLPDNLTYKKIIEKLFKKYQIQIDR